MNLKVAPKISDSVNKELETYPALIRQLLFNRGIETNKQADGYFDVKEEFGDPFLLYGMDKTVKFILNAIENKKKIFIHGDFDVDGVSATSILWNFLYKELKADVLPYIPSRFEEGYGMTEESVGAIVEQGGKLIISVDCGIKDHELISNFKAQNPKLDFIITDHHSLAIDEKDNPIVSDEAIAVIHPMHPKSQYKFKELCGTAVAWKLIKALIKESGVEVKPDKYLDFVALATVCDVMPLIEENRSIVKYGIEKMKETENLGLRMLMQEAGIETDKLEAYHPGFVIGPRINAAGRLEHAMDAVRLFTTDSLEKAKEYTENLSRLNFKRRTVTEELLEKAEAQIQKDGLDKKLYFVWGEDWPEGVVGLVAGKLTEKYGRPVLVASTNGQIAKGSARSISELNIVELIAESSELLDRFGGHAQAAGFSLPMENLELFRDNLWVSSDKLLGEEQIGGSIEADAEVNFSDMSNELINMIEKMKPFGYGNKTPTFIVNDIKILSKKNVGSESQHTSLFAEQNGTKMRGIGFYTAEKFEGVEQGDKISLHVGFDMNEWNGNKNVEFRVKNLVN